jgi:hypothetical protein
MPPVARTGAAWERTELGGMRVRGKGGGYVWRRRGDFDLGWGAEYREVVVHM